MPDYSFHSAGGNVSHVLEGVVDEATRSWIAIPISVESKQGVDTPSVGFHLCSFVATQGRQQRTVGQELDSGEFSQSLPVRILVVSMAVANSEPSLAFRCFHVADITETIWTVSFVASSTLLSNPFLNALERALGTMCAGVGQEVKAEGAGATDNDDIISRSARLPWCSFWLCSFLHSPVRVSFSRFPGGHVHTALRHHSAIGIRSSLMGRHLVHLALIVLLRTSRSSHLLRHWRR
mmetsp:Transcript_11033/g.17345  ORF Transcript_11033/g.17345 Transcript_11033/m.17345 type:complete len:236 (+) Transcript_11033:2371-3078(+)